MSIFTEPFVVASIVIRVWGPDYNHIMKEPKTKIRITANDEMKNISLLAKLLYMV